jgi:hypothetical protein
MGGSACSDIYRTSTQTSSRIMSPALCLEVLGAVWERVRGTARRTLNIRQLIRQGSGAGSGKRLVAVWAFL